MATQSNLTTMLRTLVMLSCLVAIPAVAVSGKSLPEMVKGLVSRGGLLSQGQAIQDVPDQIAWNVSAPPAPATNAAEATPGSSSGVNLRAAGGFSPRWPAVASDPLLADPRSGSVASPSWPVTPDPSAPGDAMASSVAAGVAAPDNTVLGSRQEPASPQVRSFERSPDVQAPADPNASARNLFGQAENRLRQLGATYYLLESWGQQEPLYRFYCRVSVTGSPNYTRYFEATAAEPLAAMGRVLADVEAWRGAR